MAAEQSIRVTAKGDFTELQRGLKQLRDDLKGVTGEIDKGARKGGFFDDSQIRALDFFGRRFKTTMQELKDSMQEHGQAFERLLSLSRQASTEDQKYFSKEIDYRSQMIDQIEDQVDALQKLYSQRQQEADQLRRMEQEGTAPSGRGRGRVTHPSPAPSEESDSGGTGAAGGGLESILGSIVGGGKMLLGMAGLSGVAALATEAYRGAYTRNTLPLDLAQRVRGSEGRDGSAVSMFDASGDVGRRDNMGYTNAESWQFLDAYSRLAGAPSEDQQEHLMKFGRAYGLGEGEVAGAIGQSVQAGGGKGSDIADAIASSVEKSGMTPRIVEVMDTNNALLKEMNTTLKDGSAKQILAYQTTLDRIGTQNGMTQLTGASGANVIGGLGGIFSPGASNPWQWMGIQALRQYDPKKYGNMDLFHLQETFQDGLIGSDGQPSDNIAALSKYMKGASGGDKELGIRMLQKWLSDGGYNATLRQTSQIYDATNGLQAFSPDTMKQLQNGTFDFSKKYDDTRKNEAGQGYLQNESKFQEDMAKLGQPIVDAVQGLKGTIDKGLDVAVGWEGKLADALDALRKMLSGDDSGKSPGSDSAVVPGSPPFVKPPTPEEKKRYALAYDWDKHAPWYDPNKLGNMAGDALHTGAKGLLDSTVGKMPQVNSDAVNQTDNAIHQGAKGATDWVRSKSTILDSITKFFDGEMVQGWFSGGGNHKSSLEAPQKMQQDVKDLSEHGVSYFQSMDKTVSSQMALMTQEMMNFRKTSTGIMLAGLPGGAGSGNGTVLASLGRGAGNGSGGVLGGSNVSADQLDAKLGGVLSGYGQAFLMAGNATGIDPTFLAAVAMHETGNGTSDAAKNRHNVGGMMGQNGLMNFGSIGEGIFSMANNLKKNYVDDGLVSIDQIQKRYAPVGADNDPNNLNSNWTSGVEKYMQILGDGAISKQLAGTSTGGAVTASTKHDVNINITGEGAAKVNAMTEVQLQTMVDKAIRERERQQRLIMPTTRTVGT